MAQTFYPIDPVEVTPDTPNDWITCDVSAHIASGATGVILHLAVPGSSAMPIGLRKNGSTDDRHASVYSYQHCWAAIGVDENRIFEVYVGSTSAIDVYLVGYTMSGVTFATNAAVKTPDAGEWLDIDCSSEAPSATGLIFEIQGIKSTAYPMGMRKNGSSDARIDGIGYHYCFGVIIGCDASQLVEGYLSNSFNEFYLVGYITDGCTFNTNATDVSLDSTDEWLVLTALPSGAVMGFIEVVGGLLYYGLRENGSEENIVLRLREHAWGFIECDASQLIQGNIASTDIDFFVVGYATEEVAPPVRIPRHGVVNFQIPAVV